MKSVRAKSKAAGLVAELQLVRTLLREDAAIEPRTGLYLERRHEVIRSEMGELFDEPNALHLPVLTAELELVQHISRTDSHMSFETRRYLDSRAVAIKEVINNISEQIVGASPQVTPSSTMPSRSNPSAVNQDAGTVPPGWPWTKDMWASEASEGGLQYKTVYIEWSKSNLGKAYFKVLRNAGSLWERREQVVQDMVLFYLEDYFKQGWALDGSYDQSVTLMFDDGHLLTGNQRLIQARARLRK